MVAGLVARQFWAQDRTFETASSPADYAYSLLNAFSQIRMTDQATQYHCENIAAV